MVLDHCLDDSFNFATGNTELLLSDRAVRWPKSCRLKYKSALLGAGIPITQPPYLIKGDTAGKEREKQRGTIIIKNNGIRSPIWTPFE
jgi:hypothetical protein